MYHHICSSWTQFAEAKWDWKFIEPTKEKTVEVLFLLCLEVMGSTWLNEKCMRKQALG